VESLADSESQPPPSLPWTEIYTSAGAPLIHYITEAWEHDAQGCLETNLHNNPTYPFATRAEEKYMLRGIKKHGMNTYYDNVQK
jgi:hypothetical protein